MRPFFNTGVTVCASRLAPKTSVSTREEVDVPALDASRHNILVPLNDLRCSCGLTRTRFQSTLYCRLHVQSARVQPYITYSRPCILVYLYMPGSRLPAESRPQPGQIPARASPRPASASVSETVLLLLAQSGLVASWALGAELQLASLAVCEACRSCVPTSVRVTKETPSYVWTRDYQNYREERGAGTDSRGKYVGRGWSTRGRHGKGIGGGGGDCDRGGRGARECAHDGAGSANNSSSDGASRLPPLQISSLTWERPAAQLGDGSLLPACLRELTFDREFNKKLDGFKWPPRLERVTFGSKFNRDIAGAGAREGAVGGAGARRGAGAWGGIACKLPDSLVELTFGKQFNKPLPERLPARLTHLTLGRNFRRSLRAVVWPSGLKVVKFGEAMLGRPPSVSGVESVLGLAWPAGLDRVEFCANGNAVATLRGGKVEWDRGGNRPSELGGSD